MDILAKMGYVFQTCALKLNRENESAEPRFSLPIIKKDRLLPFAKPKTFLNKYPERLILNSKNSKTVAIFIGCLGNYTYLNIGDSLVNILQTLDINIFIPKKQLCCGAPAYFTGDFDTVDFLIKKNIKYFETFIDEVDAVIIPEATCSAMINRDWEHFLHDQPEWKERAKKLSSKIFLATKWLHDNTKLGEVLKAKEKNLEELVTYHDPCHAKKMQGVYKEPRELLSANYKIKEMSDSNACCGFGGVTMQSEKYHLAKAVGSGKAKMIQETEATIVSAECSACRMQITDSLYQENIKNVKFKNPIELIWEALK